MTKASDNEFPSLLIKEGSAPSSPAAGDQRLYVDSTTHHLQRKNSSGTIVDIEGSASPLTTKGDIHGFSTVDARLAVGSDGQVLTADSTQSLGIKWAAAGGGSSGYALDTYAIDGTYGDDFTGSSLSGIWTRRNFTSGAESYQLGKSSTYTRIAMTSRASGDGYFQTAPAGDWTFAMAFVPRSFSAFSWAVAVINSSGTGCCVSLADVGSGQAAVAVLGVTTYSTYSGSFSSNTTSTGWNLVSYNEAKVWLALRKSGTNYYASASRNGEIFGPESAAFSSAITVDRVGMIVNPQSGITTTATVDVDWFNKIA